MLNYMDFKYTVFAFIPIFIAGNFCLNIPIINLEKVNGCQEPEAAALNANLSIIVIAIFFMAFQYLSLVQQSELVIERVLLGRS